MLNQSLMYFTVTWAVLLSILNVRINIHWNVHRLIQTHAWENLFLNLDKMYMVALIKIDTKSTQMIKKTNIMVFLKSYMCCLIIKI